MYVPTLPVFSPSSLLASKPKDHNWGQVCFYWRGMQALSEALKGLKRGRGNSVLVPAFICSEVIRTVLASGLQPSFYDVDSSVRLSAEHLENLFRERKYDILLVVHYFGFAQPMKEIAELCKEYGVALIEDCAHVVPDVFGHRRLGGLGSVAIYSLWKTLPIPDGAVLLWNDSASPLLGAPLASDISDVGRRVLKETLRWVLWKLQISPAMVAKYPSEAEVQQNCRAVFDHDSNNPVKAKAMTSLSRRILAAQDLNEVVRIRRQNFAWWLDRLPQVKGIEPVYPDLPPDIVPFSFPVLVDDRDQLREKLSKRGIFMGAGFPEAPVVPATEADRFKSSRYLAEHLLELPVHQRLRPWHLEKTAEALRRFL